MEKSDRGTFHQKKCSNAIGQRTHVASTFSAQRRKITARMRTWGVFFFLICELEKNYTICISDEIMEKKEKYPHEIRTGNFGSIGRSELWKYCLNSPTVHGTRTRGSHDAHLLKFSRNCAHMWHIYFIKSFFSLSFVLSIPLTNFVTTCLCTLRFFKEPLFFAVNRQASII